MKRSLRRACERQLRETFQMDGYRPGQRAAASALLRGRDLLCILPTGAGKSLCWQLPALVHGGLTVVVSPLIALMQDQVRHLREKGVAAVALHSLMTARECTEAAEAIRAGRAGIVFVSPERLETRAFRQLCRDCPPWLVVVDEAHCVVRWGEEFRPAYGHIGAYVKALAQRPVLCAMTATADAQMQRRVIESLGMARPQRVTLPVMRENLHYHVRTTTDRTREILRIAARHPARTVIFCRSRSRTEQLAETLRRAGLVAEHYHAGLNRAERIAVQQRFQRGETGYLAATTAFGMGIDIPDIRRVIHDGLPESIIDLVQQSGRAGRDGQDAECILLIAPGELIRRGELLRTIHAATRWRPLRRHAAMQENWLPLREVLRATLTAECIPAALGRALGQRTRRCGCCSACLNGPLVKRVPPLPYQQEETLRQWLLRWQRDAIAAQRGVPAAHILTGEELRCAARTMTLPPMEDASAQQAMARLLEAICWANGQQAHPPGKAEEDERASGQVGFGRK